jgi:hypothetical protein
MHKLKAQMDSQLGLATQISAQLHTCTDNGLCLGITFEVQVSIVTILIKAIRSGKSTIMYHRITVVLYALHLLFYSTISYLITVFPTRNPQWVRL